MKNAMEVGEGWEAFLTARMSDVFQLEGEPPRKSLAAPMAVAVAD